MIPHDRQITAEDCKFPRNYGRSPELIAAEKTALQPVIDRILKIMRVRGLLAENPK